MAAWRSLAGSGTRVVSVWSAHVPERCHLGNCSHVFPQVSALHTDQDRTPKAGVGRSLAELKEGTALVVGAPSTARPTDLRSRAVASRRGLIPPWRPGRRARRAAP